MSPIAVKREQKWQLSELKNENVKTRDKTIHHFDITAQMFEHKNDTYNKSELNIALVKIVLIWKIFQNIWTLLDTLHSTWTSYFSYFFLPWSLDLFHFHGTEPVYLSSDQEIHLRT